MWHRRTMELERVRQQLRGAGSDAAAIAHAAREGAGVLAAWSVALEGEQPGALARAARQLARSGELPAHTPLPPKTQSRACGLALFMLAAGKPDTPVGWMIVAREIAVLAAELARIEAALEQERPRTGEELDAEAQAANRAREPLPPPTRDPGRQGTGETKDIKRLINPLRGRRPRRR